MVLKKYFIIFITSLRQIILVPVGVFKFISDLLQFIKQNGKHSRMPIKGIVPMVTDRYSANGFFDKHYFLQDIYVASKVIDSQPERHFDIGSRVDGFVAHLLAAYKGELVLIDIRPLPVKIDRLHFIQADATNLENIEDESIESLSCLHAIEHFGLGRYGDKIDPKACYTAMKSIERVLSGGGYLYFSVPVGKENAVYFNSHRVFKPKTILQIFDKMKLVEFSYIHEYKIVTLKGEQARKKIENNAIPISNYDCGIFIFKKK